MARPKQRIGINRESRFLKRVKRSEPGHSSISSSSQELDDTSESEGLTLPETWLDDAMQQHQEAEITTPPEVQPQHCTVVGEHVITADVDDAPAPAPAPAARSSAQEKEFNCTTCGKPKREILEHPYLGVGICRACVNFLFSSPYTKSEVDGSEEHCRWCGEGGEIVMCDDCDRAFCQGCIVRNFSQPELHAIVSSVHWSCYSCKPEALRDHVEGFQRFKASVGEADFFPERRRQSVGKPRTGRRNATDFSRMSDLPTVTEMLAQQKERWQQNPGQPTKPRGKRVRKNAAPGSNKRTSSSHQTGMNKRQYAKECNLTMEEIIKKGGPRPPEPLVQTYLRPHQHEPKKAAERRRRAEEQAAERLKNITNDRNIETNITTDHNEKASFIVNHNHEKNIVTDHDEKTIIIINDDDDERNNITNDDEKNIVTDHNEKIIIINDDDDEEEKKNNTINYDEKNNVVTNHDDEKEEMVAQVKSECGDDDGEKRDMGEKMVFFSEVSGGDLMQTTEDAFGDTAKNLFANFAGASRV